jgi:hydroxymethylglutaryl-CoA reductase
MSSFQDRRRTTIPVENERRQSISPNLDVVEARMDFHEHRITQNEELTTRLIEKLDEHIQTNTQRDLEIQRNLANITGAMTGLTGVVSETNNTLKSIAALAEKSNAKWIKFDAAWKTIATVATVVTVVIGGLWTVGTYVADRTDTVQVTGK